MWSMPRSVLRVVAVIIGLCAVGGFVLGVRGAPEKARLPGEGAPGAAAGVQLQATDAKPLDDAALAPPPPVVVEKAEEETKPADKQATADPLDLAADQALDHQLVHTQVGLMQPEAANVAGRKTERCQLAGDVLCGHRANFLEHLAPFLPE